MCRAVVRSQAQDRGGCALSELDAEFPRPPAVDGVEIVRELLVEGCLLRRKQGAQGVMRRFRNRGFHRRVARRGGKPGEALISARDRADRVEDGDVYDRHRAARAGRAELLAEDARFSIRHWRVIEAARVDRDFVPVPDHSPRGRIMARSPGRALRVGIVAVERSQRVFHAIAKSLRLRPGRKQNAGNDKRSGADAGEASDKPMIAGGGRIHGRAFRTYEDQSALYGFRRAEFIRPRRFMVRRVRINSHLRPSGNCATAA